MQEQGPRRAVRRSSGCRCPEGSAGDRLLAALGYEVRWTSWVLQLPEGAAVVERPLPQGYAVREADPAEYPRRPGRCRRTPSSSGPCVTGETYEDFGGRAAGRPGFEPWMLRVVTDETGAVVGVATASQLDDAGRPAFIPRLAVRQ